MATDENKIDMASLKKLRLIGIVEGISTLVLFGVAMPMKYFASAPMAVKIVGPIHGIFFIALVYALAMAIQSVPISPKQAAMGVIGAIFPFGPFVFDRYLVKSLKVEDVA